ncbi:MAG: hypothetical protein WCI50_02105 [Actinomycetes bacterium]
MAKNPDPNLSLQTLDGVTRTLDDWTTMFHYVLVVLPDDQGAEAWIPVARRIFKTFGDSDARVAFVVPSTAAIARRILDHHANEQTVFVDPDRSFVEALGLTRLPALVHLRQNATVAACAEGWKPTEWQQVAREIARAMAWSTPEVSGPGDPAPTPGWPALR